jgi:hypothetical protein
MIPLIRNIILIFLVLTLIYAVLSFTGRARERARLRAEFKTQSELKQITDTNEDFVARGMKTYLRSYKPKLLIGIYVIPGILAAGLIYLAQYT